MKSKVVSVQVSGAIIRLKNYNKDSKINNLVLFLMSAMANSATPKSSGSPQKTKMDDNRITLKNDFTTSNDASLVKLVYHYQSLQSRNAFMEIKTVYNKVKPLSTLKNRKARLRLKESGSLKKPVWANETKMFLYQSDGR